MDGWDRLDALPGRTVPSPEPLPEPLPGRARELAVISEFLVRAAHGGGALLIRGEPGIGKTALLDAAAARAAAAGTRVLRASAAEFEAHIPFACLHQLLLPAADELAALPGSLRMALTVALGLGGGRPPARRLACEATLALVGAVSRDRPLLIIADDLHQADRPTRQVLGFLAARLAGAGGAPGPAAAGLIAVVRDAPRRPPAGPGPATLTLRPLDDVAAARLMAASYPLLPAAARRSLLAEARGNPLAVLELPRGLAMSGRAKFGQTEPWHVSRWPASVPVAPPLHRYLRRLYAARLAALPLATREALLMLALDSTGDLRVAEPSGNARANSSGTGRGGGGTPAVLAAAERAGLVDVPCHAGRATFRHPLLRSAVVELATPGQRRRAHRLLAELLADDGGGTEGEARRAWHLGEATLDPDEEVAALLERGARAVGGRGAGGTAVTMLIRAAELSQDAAARSRRLAVAARVAVNLAGDLDGARALLAQARQANPGHADPAEAVVAAAIVALHGDGDATAARRLLLGVTGSAGAPGISPATRTEALRGLADACRYAGQAERWPPAQPNLLAPLGAAVASLASLSDPAEVVRIADAASLADRLPGCRQALRRVVADQPDGGAAAPAVRAGILLAQDAFLAGQWDAAERYAATAAARGEAVGLRLLRYTARAVGALVSAGRGDVTAAQAAADEVIRWAAPRGLRHLEDHGRHACALAALARRDFAAAYRHAATLAAPDGQLDPRQPAARRAVLDLVESALRTGRADEARGYAKTLLAADVAAVSPRLALLCGAAAALVAPDEEAHDLFERALAVPGAGQWPWDHARVRLLYGERLRRTHALAAARVQLSAARDAFARLGAVPWAERAAMELAATGQARLRCAPPGRDGLTPQERQIAQLAAAGLSNKEIASRLFLSHRTVGAHLYRVFPKLGITSRAALRDALTDLPAQVACV